MKVYRFGSNSGKRVLLDKDTMAVRVFNESNKLISKELSFYCEFQDVRVISVTDVGGRALLYTGEGTGVFSSHRFANVFNFLMKRSRWLCFPLTVSHGKYTQYIFLYAMSVDLEEVLLQLGIS